MQNHSFKINVFEVSIFHCFSSKFKVSNAYFVVKNKHLRIMFGLISKEIYFPYKCLIKKFKKIQIQTYKKMRRALVQTKL